MYWQNIVHSFLSLIAWKVVPLLCPSPYEERCHRPTIHIKLQKLSITCQTQYICTTREDFHVPPPLPSASMNWTLIRKFYFSPEWVTCKPMPGLFIPFLPQKNPTYKGRSLVSTLDLHDPLLSSEVAQDSWLSGDLLEAKDESFISPGEIWNLTSVCRNCFPKPLYSPFLS